MDGFELAGDCSIGVAGCEIVVPVNSEGTDGSVELAGFVVSDLASESAEFAEGSGVESDGAVGFGTVSGDG